MKLKILGLTRPTPESRTRELLALLKSKPFGLRTHEVARAMCLSVGRAGQYLGEIRAAGQAVYLGGAGNGRWVHPDRMESARAEYDRVRGARRTILNKRCIESKEKAAAIAHESWAEKPPVRILVSANDAPPIIKRGPASIWELAA